MLEISLDLKQSNFKGDLLDIGFHNYGVIYNIYKQNNAIIDIQYINEDKKNFSGESFYDSCALFLSLSGIMSKMRRKILLSKIYNVMRDDGEIHIWDIDKRYFKTFNKKVNIYLPNNKNKEIHIKDLNILKDTSKEGTIKIINKWFDIIDIETWEGLYYIKAQKKRREENNAIKSIASGD
jgi:hypothetical protein